MTTKQNLLCDRRSVKTIMDSSRQLLPKTSKDLFEYREPVFKYTLPKPKLYILVLDRAFEKGSSQSGWELLQMSLFGFISRLERGSSLSVVTYGGESEAVLSLRPTLVTGSNAQGLHGRIPRRASEVDSDTKSCLECALRLAQEQVLPSAYDSRIIVATSSTDFDLEKKFAGLEKIPVFAVLLPPTNAINTVTSEKLDNLDALTSLGGVYSVNPKDDSVPAYLTAVNDAFSAVAKEGEGENAVTFHKETREPLAEGFTGNFVVEEHLSKNLWVSATVKDERDVETFEVLSPTGRRHALPYYDHGMAYFHLKGFNEPGIWSYNIKLYPSAAKTNIEIEVMGTQDGQGLRREEAPITVKSWTEVSKHEDRTEVIIYAQITQGSLPVIDADVKAFVSRPGRPTVEAPVTIKLKDSGTGYPDVTANDGIYSAYFTDFSGVSGYYSISIEASHNSGSAKTPKMNLESGEETVCCGSQVPYSYTIPTGPFLRFVQAPSFHVEQPEDSFYVRHQRQKQQLQSEFKQGDRLVSDVFPPSRVTDIKVENYLPESLFVTLSWTSPGGDFDSGRAFKYEIRCYTNRQALRDESFAEMSIPVHASLIPQPEEAGREQRCTVGVPWPNEVFYYAVVAFDEAGNRGKISNTVAVFIREDPEVAPAEVEDDASNEVLNSLPLPYQDNQGYLAYVVVAAVSLTLVLITILAAAAIRRYYRGLATSSGFIGDAEKSSSAASSSSSEDDDYSSLAGTLKKIMAQRQLKHQASVLMVKPADAEPADVKKWDTLMTNGSNSPTSDYGSASTAVIAKAPLPSISAGVSTTSYVRGMQKATSQELAGIHKVVLDSPEPVEYHYPIKRQTTDCESRTATHSTDCSVYSDNHNNSQQQVPDSPTSTTVPGPATRISVLEDFSVYRDLSNMSSGDYLSYNQLPQGFREKCVPPYYDLDGSTMRSNSNKRHESLV